MNKLLINAQKKLSIKNVVIHKCLFETNEDITTLGLINKYKKQGFNRVTTVNILKPNNNIDNSPIVYVFDYSLGLRMVEHKDEQTTDITDKIVLFLIEATFKVIYSANEELSDEEIKAFSEDNVGYHVWPYWRELVQSSCLRANISPAEVPFYKSKKK